MSTLVRNAPVIDGRGTRLDGHAVPVDGERVACVAPHGESVPAADAAE